MIIYRCEPALGLKSDLVVLALLLAVAGCGSQQQGSSSGVVPQATPTPPSIIVALTAARDVKRAVDERRVEYQEQTAAKVSAEEAHLLANMDNYTATGAGVRARMNQENYIKESRIAGLKAEQRLLEHTLPLLRAIEAASSVGGSGAAADGAAKLEGKLADETKSVRSYLNVHPTVQFPSRAGAVGIIDSPLNAEEAPTEPSSPSLDDLIRDTVDENKGA